MDYTKWESLQAGVYGKSFSNPLLLFDDTNPYACTCANPAGTCL